ncbi:hypothetical protein J6590_071185 [Homalodisca vitripennis]|nr:hypothetical protein J6590_071185 [Homalodisca vitripennis]
MVTARGISGTVSCCYWAGYSRCRDSLIGCPPVSIMCSLQSRSRILLDTPPILHLSLSLAYSSAQPILQHTESLEVVYLHSQPNLHLSLSLAYSSPILHLSLSLAYSSAQPILQHTESLEVVYLHSLAKPTPLTITPTPHNPAPEVEVATSSSQPILHLPPTTPHTPTPQHNLYSSTLKVWKLSTSSSQPILHLSLSLAYSSAQPILQHTESLEVVYLHSLAKPTPLTITRLLLSTTYTPAH